MLQKLPIPHCDTDMNHDLESQGDSALGLGQTDPSEKPKESRFDAFKPGSRTISDAILGLSDGLTVPFALSAGLSSFGTTNIVIMGGLAELVAGAISMGLGGFLGARSEVYAPATFQIFSSFFSRAGRKEGGTVVC
jgi:vacuolar iron transporter family protein